MVGGIVITEKQIKLLEAKSNIEQKKVRSSFIDNMDDYKGSGKLRPEYHINNDENCITVLGEKVKYGSYIILRPVDYVLDQTVQFDEETGLPFKYDFTDVSTR